MTKTPRVTGVQSPSRESPVPSPQENQTKPRTRPEDQESRAYRASRAGWRAWSAPSASPPPTAAPPPPPPAAPPPPPRLASRQPAAVAQLHTPQRWGWGRALRVGGRQADRRGVRRRMPAGWRRRALALRCREVWRRRPAVSGRPGWRASRNTCPGVRHGSCGGTPSSSRPRSRRARSEDSRNGWATLAHETPRRPHKDPAAPPAAGGAGQRRHNHGRGHARASHPPAAAPTLHLPCPAAAALPRAHPQSRPACASSWTCSAAARPLRGSRGWAAVSTRARCGRGAARSPPPRGSLRTEPATPFLANRRVGAGGKHQKKRMIYFPWRGVPWAVPGAKECPQAPQDDAGRETPERKGLGKSQVGCESQALCASSG
eukprot:scaffold692_cov92-Isochrysis_galbana.AAC.5